MDASDHVWRSVRASLEKARSIADLVTVVVVANLKLQAPLADQEVTSPTTEYLSENEAGQILLSLSDNGFYTKLYSGELDLINSVLRGAFKNLPRAYKLVYNIAQSGRGPGRKSLVPAFCALNEIPICNSDAYVVSLARNKFHVYCILRTLGISVPDSWLFDSARGWLLNSRPPTRMRLIAKASYESASIGLTHHSLGEMSSTFEDFLRERSEALGQPLIVQRFVSGYEAEVPVIDFGEGPVALEPILITLLGNTVLADRILDYEIVERDDYSFARSTLLSESIRRQMRDHASATFAAIGIREVGRVDFRITSPDGPIYVTDVSTSPHLVRHSSFAFAFTSAGLSHADLMGTIIGLNVHKFGQR